MNVWIYRTIIHPAGPGSALIGWTTQATCLSRQVIYKRFNIACPLQAFTNHSVNATAPDDACTAKLFTINQEVRGQCDSSHAQRGHVQTCTWRDLVVPDGVRHPHLGVCLRVSPRSSAYLHRTQQVRCWRYCHHTLGCQETVLHLHSRFVVLMV